MYSEDYILIEVEGKQREVIDDVRDTQFEYEGEQFEVIDEITNAQFESEDGFTEEVVTTGQKTHAETQQFIEEESKTEQGEFVESTKQAKGSVEEICSVPIKREANITKPQPRSEPSSEQVVGAEITSEGNRNVSKVSDVEKVSDVLNRSNEKQFDGHQSSTQTEMENKQITFVQNTTDSQVAPERSGKLDENTIGAKAKQTFIRPPPLRQPILLDSNVLLVGGLLSGLSGDLKQLLNATLGIGSHRIEPRQRGDSVLRVHFSSKHVMEIARELLHKQMFLGCKLNAVVDPCQPTKRKAEVDDVNKPPVKKLKEDRPVPQFPDISYKALIAQKTEDVQLKLHQLAKVLRDSYPRYNYLNLCRELKNGGLLCPLNRFKECPSNERFGNRCKFSVGTDKVTGQLAVGFPAGGGYVKNISSVKHNFPPHVVEAAKVFEKAIHAFEETLKDSEDSYQYQFLHNLVIRTNLARELMVLVFVHCSQDVAAGRIKLLNKELKEFFENGEGKKCRVVSVYTRVTTSLNSEQKLLMGSPYLEETLLGLKFHLLPTMHFWHNSRAAEMVCKGVEELLVPTKKISVVEVGYGFGLIGLHLSRVAGEVLSVVSQHSIEEAQKNATCNKITNCHYFSDSTEAVFLEVAKKIGYKKAYVVMICNVNPRTTSTITMNAIRKIEKVRRLVIVTEMFKSSFNPIVALCNPSSEEGMGNPFFPVRAVPVDTMPNASGYILMIQMKRMGLPSPKSLGLPKSDPAIHWTEKGSDSHSRADCQLTIISRREERLRYREAKKAFRASGRHRLAGCEYLAGGYFKIPSSDDEPNALEEHDIRESKAEEQRRWTEEEECMVQIEEEKQRRLMEEHQRWVEEKELKRQVEEREFRRKIDEKEFKRQVEERELKRQIEEKEMKRQIEEQREKEMLRRTSLNLRSRNDMVQDLIADSLREANIPQLSEDTAQKLKQLLAEAVRSVGTLDQDERHSVVSTSTGFGGMHPENITISRFVRHDKDIPELRRFEEGYSRHIMEVDSLFERRYDVHGGGLERSERYEEKLMPQSGRFEEGYSQSVMEVNSLYQHGYNAYEGAVGRESYQHNLKPQQSVYSMREVPVGHIGVDRAGSQPPKLRDLSGGCSNSAARLESGGDSYMRNVYHSDVSPSQRQKQSFGQSLDSYTRQNIFPSDYAGNERQPLQYLKPSLLPAVEHDTDSHARLRAMKWSLANTSTNYVPLSNSRKYMACSTPKPPGTEDLHHPEGSSYMYEDPAPRVTNSSRWQCDNSSSYLTLETKDSTQDYRNRMQDEQGQDRTQQTRYFM